LEQEPTNVKVRLGCAKAYVNIKEYSKALLDLNTIIRGSLPDNLRSQVADLVKEVKKVCDKENEMRKKELEKEKAKREAQEHAKEEEKKKRQEEVKQTMNQKQAESFNDKGNIQYKAFQFKNAILLYTDAIKLSPKVEKYYTNRSACYMALNDYEKALPDAIKAVDIDPSCWKGYSRAINCFMILGNIKQAKIYIDKMQNNIPVIDSIKFNEIPKLKELEGHDVNISRLMIAKNYDECLKYLESALKIAKECKEFIFKKAECLVMLRRWNEAVPLISKYKTEPQMIFLKGLNTFLEEDFTGSIEFFKEALRLDPELKHASKYRHTAKNLQNLFEELRDYKSLGNNRAAIDCCTRIISYEHDNVKIKLKALVGRAKFNFKIFQYRDAFEDCSLALKLHIPDLSNGYYTKALLLRAKIHIHNEEFDFAIIDCDEILRLSKDATRKTEAENLKSDAKSKSAHQATRNHFDILQVPRNAPFAVIKEAFRNLSKQYHSDKHPDATPLEKKKLEKKFQEIRTAYECLKV
jgi:DnaJ family protein C protein 7